MKVLIACEESGVFRRAFAALGHDAWSCDLLPARDSSGQHIQGDALDQLDKGWDLMVAHPPCIVLCNSGVKHLYIGGRKENGPEPTRWAALEKSVEFYCAFRDAKQITHRAIENPIMHSHAIAAIKRGHVQFVQPWWFGDAAFKATGFELINLPNLVPTKILPRPRIGSEEYKYWSKIHLASPGPNRSRDRSETFPGLAKAAALQWSTVVGS